MEKKLITAFPFAGKTIEEIIQAGSQYDIHETNHGHSYDILMNHDILNINDDEIRVMVFIKFVEEEIRKCAQEYDIDNLTPEQIDEITDFINMILNRIALMVSTLNQNGERPTPADVRSCLGQKPSYGDIYLFDIIELIMNSQGYMHVPETFDEIAELNFVPINLAEAMDVKIKELIDPNVSYGSK